jgi:hypothetical protein
MEFSIPPLHLSLKKLFYPRAVDTERSTTAWQVARWRNEETLISVLKPPGLSLSQFWYDCGRFSGTLGLLYRFPSVPCAFLRAGVLENKLQVPPCAVWYGVLMTWQDATTHGFFREDLFKETGELVIFGNLWILSPVQVN